MSNLLNARQVKNELAAKYGNEPWFAGIGTSRDDGVGFVVRVSVKKGVPVPDGVLPQVVNGVTILVVEAPESH
jgi:hypothetical protein